MESWEGFRLENNQWESNEEVIERQKFEKIKRERAWGRERDNRIEKENEKGKRKFDYKW